MTFLRRHWFRLLLDLVILGLYLSVWKVEDSVVWACLTFVYLVICAVYWTLTWVVDERGNS